MTAPSVWQHALATAERGAQVCALQVLDVNAQAASVPPGAYWFIEANSSRGDLAEMGTDVNEENGAIWLHLMAVRGTGTLAALEQVKAMSDTFRKAQRGDYGPLPVGLTYYTQNDDPADGNQDGNRVRFSISFDYQYRDSLEPPTA